MLSVVLKSSTSGHPTERMKRKPEGLALKGRDVTLREKTDRESGKISAKCPVGESKVLLALELLSITKDSR